VANLRGIHQALFLEGHPVDFIDSNDIAANGSHYKVLLHPCPIALGKQAITVLRDYVHGGGILISGPCPGRFDRFGFGSPGEMPGPLAELFGVEHRQLLTLSGRQPHPSQSSLTPEPVNSLTLTGSGDYAGGSVRAEFYLQYFVTKSAEAILRYKTEITGTSNSFGSGKAILIGTLLGNSAGAASTENQAFLASLLRKGGVKPDRVGRLIRRRRLWEGKEAWFFFNLERESVSEVIPLLAGQSATDLFGESLTAERGGVRLFVRPRDIACLIIGS